MSFWKKSVTERYFPKDLKKKNPALITSGNSQFLIWIHFINTKSQEEGGGMTEWQEGVGNMCVYV